MGNHYFYEYMNHITNKLNWVGTVKLCTQMENTNSFEDHMEHYQKYPLHKPLSSGGNPTGGDKQNVPCAWETFAKLGKLGHGCS